MTSDRDLEAAAAMGRKNSRTLILAKNWCAHIRMTRFGGGGMIEQMTGDPIGHLGLECDHAGRDGMSCWDLADAAIDFYDRHCSVCTVRKPVGLPNLSELIGERDRQAAERAREEQRLEAEATAALAERQQQRDQLKSGLSTLSATIVDDIGDFDADRSEANFKRLTESARLAPEHFPQELIHYVLDLARVEEWFRPAALAMLRHVGASPRSLLDLARGTLSASADLASSILLDHASLLTPDDLHAVVPRAADRANPDRSRSYGASPENQPALLLGLYQAHREGVIDVLKAELGERSRYRVERAARGFRAIQKVLPAAADGAARDLVSTYVRAHLLIDDLDDRHERLARVSEVISGVFRNAPEAVDVLIQKFMQGADARSRARALSLYGEVVRRRDFSDREAPPTEAERLAFRRLLWAATTETDDEALRPVQEVFRHHARGLDTLAETEMEGLIGAALVMDDRLAALEKEPPKADHWIAAMERNNRRAALTGLMSTFLELAARTAADDETRIDALLETLEAVPEARERLRAEAIGALAGLTRSVTGLSRYLSQLYYGLVGASVAGRASAAAALAEVHRENRKNIPPMVYEAFTYLLWDQYVAVHKAAVRALDRFSLPEALRPEAAGAVLNILYTYRGKGDDQFLLICVERLARWREVFGDKVGPLRRLLVDTAMEIDPLYLRSSLISLAHALAEEPSFALLVVRMLPEFADDTHHRDDDCRNVLALLPDASVQHHADRFVEMAITLIPSDPWIAYAVLDRLGSAGSEAAARLAAACEAETPDTVRDRFQRATGRFIALAYAHEAAVAAEDAAVLEGIEEAWRSNRQAMDDFKADSSDRRSRAGFPFED